MFVEETSVHNPGAATLVEFRIQLCAMTKVTTEKQVTKLLMDNQDLVNNFL